MRLAVAACFIAAFAAAGAEAATRTWQGDEGTNWSTPGNWAENAAPASGDDLVFPDSPASRDSNNDIAGLSIASVAITTTNSGLDYNFTGTGITLGGAFGFTNAGSGSAGRPHWAIPLTLGASITLTSSGRLGTVEGAIVLGANTLTIAGGGDLRITGAISGAGGITKDSTSALTLAAANSYGGATLVNAGNLFAEHATALGSAATGTTFASDTGFGTGGGPFTLSEPLTFLGPTNVVYAYSGVDLAGAIAFGATLNYNAYDAGSISGALTSAGTLVLLGDDALSLVGDSPAFTGTVVIQTGSFIPQGSFPAAIDVQGPGALYGWATTGPMTMTGGTFAPGIAAQQFFAPAGLASSGGSHNLVMVPGAPVTNYDQVQVTGTVSLGGTTLNSTAAGTLALGLSFVIILNDAADPVAGTYVDKPEGTVYFQAGNWWRITYVGGDGNDVVLTTVAEPAPPPLLPAQPVPGPGLPALGALAAALAWLARRRIGR